jgi:exosome complex RNA-binding protein Rrp42 (RNase PH superfamily)
MLRLYSTLTSKRTISKMGNLFSENSLASLAALERCAHPTEKNYELI